MRSTRLSMLGALGLLFLGCASDDPGTDAGSGGLATSSPDPAGTAKGKTERICDGSDGIRLGHQRLGGANFHASFANVGNIQTEAGRDSFFVDGHCRFWVLNVSSLSPWSPGRAGVLSEQQEEELANDLAYSVLSESYGGYGAGTLDGPISFLFDARGTLSCSGLCDESTPLPARLVLPKGVEWAARLYESGADLAGPLRFRVHDSIIPGSGTLPLQLSGSLAQLAKSSALPAPSIVASEADSDALRGLRAEILALDAESPAKFNVAENGVGYTIGFRDALPFEDALGRVPRPKNVK